MWRRQRTTRRCPGSRVTSMLSTNALAMTSPRPPARSGSSRSQVEAAGPPDPDGSIWLTMSISSVIALVPGPADDLVGVGRRTVHGVGRQLAEDDGELVGDLVVRPAVQPLGERATGGGDRLLTGAKVVCERVRSDISGSARSAGVMAFRSVRSACAHPGFRFSGAVPLLPGKQYKRRTPGQNRRSGAQAGPGHRHERATGIEPATSTLARLRSSQLSYARRERSP